MVGGSGKIGGGPGSLPPQAEMPAHAATGKGLGTTTRVQDGFEHDKRPQAPRETPAPNPFNPEESGSTQFLKLARDNPSEARQLIATMRARVSQTLNQVETEMVAVRLLLQKLAERRFTKEALEKKRQELRRRREKVKTLKLRASTAQRRLSYLQQLSGKLGEARLDDKVDQLLSHHEKLQTEWGERHHLVSMAEAFYSNESDTPEHLRQVISAKVRPGAMRHEISDVMHHVAAPRVLNDLMARTLCEDDFADDGNQLEQLLEVDLIKGKGLEGEYGATLQSWLKLGQAMNSSWQDKKKSHDR